MKKLKKIVLVLTSTVVLISLIFILISLFYEDVGSKNFFIGLSKRTVAQTLALGVNVFYDPFKKKHQFPAFHPSQELPFKDQNYISDRTELDNFINMIPGGKLIILEYNNQVSVKTSFDFYYQPYNEKKLHLLRSTYQLDTIIKDAGNEYDIFIKLKNWVKSRWEYGVPENIPFNFDALEILERAENGENFFCSEYSTVFVQLALSLGFQARYGGLFKGHVVAEIWSNQFNKWIVIEPTFNIQYIKDGIPLNCLELHNEWIKGSWGNIEVIIDQPQPINFSIFEYEYKLIDYYENFYIRMRNDWFSNKYRHWHPLSNSIMNGLEWQDEFTSNSIMIARETSNPSDLYWSLNRTNIKLKTKNISNKNIDFEVYLDTYTPNFKDFMIQIDDLTVADKNPFFVWTLHKGENSLNVRSVNEFGIEGVKSRIVLKFNN